VDGRGRSREARRRKPDSYSGPNRVRATPAAHGVGTIHPLSHPGPYGRGMAPGPPRDGLLDDLDAGQRLAVTHPAGLVCILAGAGSGKTRVLTRRIAWRVRQGSAAAPHVLALTFTRRAARELRSRLRGLGITEAVAAGTFHSLALAQLRHLWAARAQAAPGLVESKMGLLAPIAPRPSGPGPALADVAAEIEWAKARLVDPEGYAAAAAAARRRPPLPPDEMAAVYHRYEEAKRRRRLVDFDDLLLEVALAMEADEAFAASQRWRFRHLFVDEVQDLNPLQHRLLEAWRGGRSDLCVVGDPHQAVYAWNGADPAYLAEFATRHPQAGVVRLEENYRSSPQVLAVANAVLGAAGRLHPHEPDGPVPTVRCLPSDRAEAEAVARSLRQLRAQGLRWHDLAVLTRTHAQLTLFEEACRAEGVPFRLRGSVGFLRHPEVAAALDDLRRRGPGTSLARAVPELEALAPPEAAGTVVEASAAGERRARLRDLVRLAREHLTLAPAATVEGFTAWLAAALEGGEGTARPGDAVEGTTFHGAKGLEWPVVFLAGLEQGLVPIGHAEGEAERAEELRLFYVGVTRARRELHCSWAQRRTFGARTVGRRPSPFLEPVQAVVAALADGQAPQAWRDYLAEGRRQVRRARDRRPSLAVGTRADPAVLDALRSWRSEVARAAGVPAYVVFHDTTLAAVAEARPRDRDGLLALPGLGPLKVERYGADLLSLVASVA